MLCNDQPDSRFTADDLSITVTGAFRARQQARAGSRLLPSPGRCVDHTLPLPRPPPPPAVTVPDKRLAAPRGIRGWRPGTRGAGGAGRGGVGPSASSQRRRCRSGQAPEIACWESRHPGLTVSSSVLAVRSGYDICLNEPSHIREML